MVGLTLVNKRKTLCRRLDQCSSILFLQGTPYEKRKYFAHPLTIQKTIIQWRLVLLGIMGNAPSTEK